MASRTIPPTTLSPCSENALACESAVCSAATQRKMTVCTSAMMARLRLFRMENECMTSFFDSIMLGGRNLSSDEGHSRPQARKIKDKIDHGLTRIRLGSFVEGEAVLRGE